MYPKVYDSIDFSPHSSHSSIPRIRVLCRVGILEKPFRAAVIWNDRRSCVGDTSTGAQSRRIQPIPCSRPYMVAYHHGPNKFWSKSVFPFVRAGCRYRGRFFCIKTSLHTAGFPCSCYARARTDELKRPARDVGEPFTSSAEATLEGASFCGVGSTSGEPWSLLLVIGTRVTTTSPSSAQL